MPTSWPTPQPGTSQNKQANAACAIASGAPMPSPGAAAPAPAPARYSEEDTKLLWEEAAFTANGKGDTEGVYTVEEFITDSGTVPVAQSAGKEIALVAGVLPGLGTSENFFKPARFRLVFQKYGKDAHIPLVARSFHLY